MKVKEIKIKDFKCLKDFNADIDGHNVILLGDNEVGKSSLIQFIKICLGDKSCIPPALNGSGELTMDMEGKDVKFILKMVNGRPEIKVRGDGISIDNNKGAIASLVGATQFNPEKFISLSETDAGRKQQVKEFKDTFISEDIRKDLAKHEANAKNYYDQRAEINKDVTKLEGAVKNNPMYNHIHELDKFSFMDISQQIKSIQDFNKINTEIAGVKQRVADREKEIENNNKAVEELKAKIDAFNAETDMLIKKQTDAKEWLKENQGIDVKPYVDALKDAERINNEHRDAQSLKKQLKEIEEKKNHSGELTAMVESARQAIADTVRQLDSTVPGLGFDEDQLIYNGVPVHPNTMSTSQRAQLAVILKRAENPNLPILLECSESWGQKKIDWLTELSEKEGFQFIAEKVESGVEKLELRIVKDEESKA